MNLSDYQLSSPRYEQLSLRDLLEARDLYHVFLMNHPNVVGTAIGRYRIRNKDSWPRGSKTKGTHGTYARTMENSEVREYSWPAILVFVEQWMERSDAARAEGALLPKTLFLPDGRPIPVCVIEAPKQSVTSITAPDIRYPLNNIRPGSPVIARVQGWEYVATVGCLVSDGHKVYALTNRHVAGDPGEVVYARLGGRLRRIGTSSTKQLTRAEFTKVYPGWPGRDTFVNLDVGLIELDDLESWTTDIPSIGKIGTMVDLSVHNMSLSLVGCRVRGVGAASPNMAGEIHGLFYRYKHSGGFEYVADLLIGPRTQSAKRSAAREPKFETLPGDSGALWLLEPSADVKQDTTGNPPPALPLAIQWGRNMLHSREASRPQSFALATLAARVCDDLSVDFVRGWNVDQPDTWGAIGHFSIATRTSVALSSRLPKLVSLMRNNARLISHDDATIIDGDFKGMGSADFVPLADVPDFFWKQRIAKQGHARAMEGPNHFADMDQPDEHGDTLLQLCRNPANINPAFWVAFYDSVSDLLTGENITEQHRGLLPFRVWQLFDAMVDFARRGKGAEFVCAAGVLTHYIGDACQPLHISYLHDGDPLRPFEHEFQSGKRAGQTETRPLGAGVHSGYEDEMVSLHREDILDGLLATPKTRANELITTGADAARLTVEMMRATFKRLPPMAIVEAFAEFDGGGKQRAEHLWKKFGKKTLASMQDGSHLLAVLWESAWKTGGGETKVRSVKAISESRAMAICADPDFVPSVGISRIDSFLR